MRLDLFLKTARLVKRRTVAKALCDEGRVLVDGRAAKAGAEVAPGQTITVLFGDRRRTVRVRAVPEEGKKAVDPSALTEPLE
ncbi:MAG: RNA-binding S4 domain-containing protein [Hydrogenibacillus sp.]|nr:RNA-binding S4 domain-containing protein [Hydrogenibacillus sp.]